VQSQSYLLMRRNLGDSIALPVWPDGVYLKTFTKDDAFEVHALLVLGYGDGGGSVPYFEEWWPLLFGDSEYDSTLCFPVCDRDARIIGFAHCWTSAFVEDVVVHPRFRRRGIGSALLLHIFRKFQCRGAHAVDLKVEVESPTGAISLYESLGMLSIVTY
jgi:ribosomal protein S18 acetylase RimI-like enzyme